jgi:RNA polymerase sigma-70 factor (ECF subfamily)
MQLHPVSDEPGEIVSLYDTFGRELWARLYAFCCDRELALDATQEAFLRLHESALRPRNPKAWLLRVGRNWLTDRARSAGRRSAEPCRDDLVDRRPDPSIEASVRELQARVRAALTELPAIDREVLALRYALDWTTAQIGSTLGMSPSAVDMRLSRARARLAAAFQAAGVTHETR